MKASFRSIVMAAALLAATSQQAAAQTADPEATLAAVRSQVKFSVLFGTTGACKNIGQFSPCTETSDLVLLDPRTGNLIKRIGPVGYTVNGLAWDRRSLRLYASTSVGDVKFHGLITINPFTGKGTPVNPTVVNFGLPLGPGGPPGPACPAATPLCRRSPISAINIDASGHMVGWYNEFGPAGTTDTYVRIDQRSGIATEFGDTGIDTNRNGLSFGDFNLLWNIDSPKADPAGVITQTAYLLNPFDGKALLTKPLSPPTNAALGDFLPWTNYYYGLNFDTPDAVSTFIVVVDPMAGTVTPLGQTVDNLHTIAFLP